MMAMRALAVGRDDLDELTLRRAQRGDPVAFRTLIDRYHRPVWDLAVRMLAGSPRAHRAEDLVQETFARVHRAISDFDLHGPARLSTWILTIASRLVLNELRASPRDRAVPIEDAIDVAADDDPSRATEAKRRAAVVAQAIAALPENARVVVILREYHDLDYVEIAHMLEIDLGTVKSRLSRARAELRERLRALDGESHE
jgi:RNA polymerase sigma-70 factor (ECF subfamily)